MDAAVYCLQAAKLSVSEAVRGASNADDDSVIRPARLHDGRHLLFVLTTVLAV